MVGMCFSPLMLFLLARSVAEDRMKREGFSSPLPLSDIFEMAFSGLALDILRCDDALAKRKAHQLDVGGNAQFGADQIAGVGRGLDADMQRSGDVVHGFLGQQ